MAGGDAGAKSDYYPEFPGPEPYFEYMPEEDVFHCRLCNKRMDEFHGKSKNHVWRHDNPTL